MAHRILDSRGVISLSRRAWVAVATVLAVVGTMLVLASSVAQPAEAASSPTVRFQQNLTGGATMVSNAFHIRSSEGLPNTATPADTDGDPSTSMSSTGDLVLPAGSTIVKAFLSAELAYDQTDPSRFDTVRFKVPNGSYVDLGPRSAQFLDRRTVTKTAQVVFDVTGLMPANGYVSTYTPGGERSGQGRYAVAADPSMGGMGGWSLIVVYSNPASTYRSVTVADDWQQFSNSTVTTDVPGVAVPASGTVKAVVGVTGTYGDPGLSDHVTVGPVGGTGTPLRNPNPTRGLETTDALNSSVGFAAANNVSADGGPAMDGCFAARNPFTGFALPYADDKVTPGCSAQYDATVFDATGAIPASSTPVNVRLTQTSTGGDALYSGSYFVSVDLAVAVLSKSVAPGRIGDGGVATYTFTVDNSAAGSVRRGGVAFTDVLPAGLRVAAVPNVQVAGASGTPVVDAAPGGARVGVSGLTVEAGAVATIRVDVTNVPGRTNPSCTGAPVDFTNGPGNATIGSGGVVNRITPVCVVVDVPQVAHLSIAKTADTTTLPTAGGTATYTVTVTNTGNADYTTTSPASFTDPLTAVLDDATLDESSITTSVGTVRVTDGILSWAGPLPAGQSATIAYTITHTGGGDHVLTNTACVPADQATPGTDPCATVRIPAADLGYHKSVDPASGTTLPDGTPASYTLTFTNTGHAPATVNATDDLTDVLDDATLTTTPTSSTPALTTALTGTHLTITGTLPPGQTATITYTATPKPWAEQTNHTLTNTLTDPNGTCTTPCTTTNPLPTPPTPAPTPTPVAPSLAITGAETNTAVTVTALTLLLAGATTLLIHHRTRRHTR